MLDGPAIIGTASGTMKGSSSVASQDAAGDAEGGGAEAEEAEQVFADEQEAEQDDQGDEQFADQHRAPPLLGDLREDGMEDRRVAERIEHEKQGHGEREEVHGGM
jgi:hypothetical protein